MPALHPDAELAELHPRFEVRGELGAGSMGVVLRAHDLELGREVALKTLPHLDPDEILHLKAEFRLLANALHRNLVELYELFSGPEHCFFTMELVEGRTFDEHVAAAGELEGRVARVIAALPQLVEGLAALHETDTLHRDIKPSNILVDEDGRVVLLDFGLAVPRLRAHDGDAAGTWDYMAPEAVWGQAGFASDWYSLGVVLHEVLAGELPFAGSIETSLLRKSRGERSRLPAEVPRWLDDLIGGLLAPSPDKRAGYGASVAAMLAAGISVAAREAPPEGTARPFVGRSDAWRRLDEASERARAGVEIVEVSGPSGIGKSELLARFARYLEAERGALVLHGRCHPQEELPYNALDAAIDELASYLEHPLVAGEALRPREPGAVARLFPVMSQLPGFAADESDAPPHVLRRRGAEGLAELLAQISERRRLALFIDDAQWGDQDSAEILRMITSAAPALRLLIVVAYREELDLGAFLRALREAAPDAGAAPSRITLEPLSRDESAALLRELAGDAAIDPEIVEVAEGSPFLLDALARSRGASSPTVDADRLGELVERRLAEVDADARHLVELTAIAAAPLPAHVVLAAANVDPRRRTVVRHLESRGLVRSGAFGGRSRLEIHHDRIRRAVVDRLDHSVRRVRHLELAEALAAYPDTDPELLVTHYVGGERPELARAHARRAAERAGASLAFERAVALYRRALALATDAGERIHLKVALAEALVNAGRGGEAAETFLDASIALRALRPGDPEIEDLRCRAAEHFVRIGRTDEGEALFREILKAIDVELPRSAGAALVRSTLGRVGVVLAGSRLASKRDAYVFRSTAEIPAVARQRLDLMWRASTSFGLSQFALADFLAVASLRLALAAGDRWYVARALGYEAASEAAMGGSFLGARSRRSLQTVEALLEDTDEPYQRAFVDVVRGTCAWQRGHWAECARACDSAIETLERSCPGSDWEAVIARVYALSSLSMLGRWAEAGPRAELALTLALERGDLFAANSYRLGDLSYFRLAADDVEGVRRRAADAEATWPKDPHHTLRFYHATILTEADLYEGDGAGAWARITGAWPMLTAGQFLRLEQVAAGLWFLRGRAALAAAQGGGSLGARRRWFVRSSDPLSSARAELGRALSVLDRSTVAPARPFAATLRAGLMAMGGDRRGAAVELAAAAADFAAVEMAAHQAAASARAAELAEDSAAAEAPRAWLTGQGVVAPEKIVRMFAPGGA